MRRGRRTGSSRRCGMPVRPRCWRARRRTGRCRRCWSTPAASRLLADGADPDTLLTRAVDRLGTPPCYVLSATGRTIARTPGAPALSAAEAAGQLKAALRVDPDASPYGQWFLHLPGVVEVPPRMLHEIAEVFAQYRQGVLRREAAVCGAAAELHTVVEVSLGAAGADGAEALGEVLRHLAGHRFAVGNLTGGRAAAVIATDSGSPEDVVPALKELWPTLHACDEAVLPTEASAPRP
ncbi:hypothetical protein [Streptomyces arboris]|uniref:hypothetical protein n=1 Tax=Streptomyces arboris TaxID=2600619 RepID=UPI00298FAE4F|nr:hypothetical protein [Streptomyces arboris]